MNSVTETQYAKVPLGQKIAFGLGMLANQLFPAAVSIFMVVLVQDLGFDPMLWGIIFFVPRLFDAITDPIMGFISDNTKSKWGKEDNTSCSVVLSWGFLLFSCGSFMQLMV